KCIHLSYVCIGLLAVTSVLYVRQRRHPRSTLFPYTTLFRSQPWSIAGNPLGSLHTTARRGDPRFGARQLFAAVVASREQCGRQRSEEHTSELQSREKLVCRLLLEKKKRKLITEKRTQRSAVN